MFESAPLSLVIGVFVGAGVIIWIAGHALSSTTEALDQRFNIGDAMGGAVFLAIATNLPEIAITVAAAVTAHFEIAIGNLLGGIAIQTVVLAILDFIVMRKRPTPLTTAAGSLVVVVQACGLAAILTITIMGTFMPDTAIAFRLTPTVVAIALAWLATLYLTGLAHRPGLPWNAQPAPREPDLASHPEALWRVIGLFLLASIATLVAGWALEETSNRLAVTMHLNGAVFAATILAATTALPELTTGITAVRMHDYELAISDIIGGNAFLPVLFLFAVVISNDPVLPHATTTDIYLAALGIILTMIYACGAIFRWQHRILGVGADSALVVAAYAFGIAGMFSLR